MEEDFQPDSSEKLESPSGIAAFWAELRRRHVVRVAITYAVVAWLIIQIAASTFEGFGIPDWAFRFVVIMVILGFPIAVLLAWAFELTPEGIKTTKTAKVQHPDSHEDKSHVKKRHWFSLGVAAAVPTLIFGVLAAFFYIQNRSLVSNTEAPVSDPVFEVEENEKSIAVLPLENMSPDPDNAFFADGVQEDILTNLAKVDELRVIARTSTQQYRDTVKTVQIIGQELGVSYIVEGSVRRAGNQVRVTVQLIDTASGDHLWAENYDRGLDDIFAIQAAVAKEIAGQLHTVLSPQDIEEIDYRPTSNLEAYEQFVKARQLIQDGGPSVAFESIGHLENAVALDPSFPEAWAFLAWQRISAWRNIYRHLNPELLGKAHEALDKAIQLATGLPHLPHAQSNFAFIEHQDYEASIEYLLEALALDPNYGFARRALGLRYGHLGRLAEAQFQFEEAVRLDPFSLAFNYPLVRLYQQRGMLDKARSLIKRNLDRTGSADTWRIMLAWNDYFKSGDRNRLFSAAVQEIPRYWNDPIHRTYYLVNGGDFQGALKSLEQADKSDQYRPTHWWGSSQTNEMIAALILFRIGDENKWLAESKKAKAKTEARLEKNPIAHPFIFSNLVICHALEGNRQAMEASITKAREITGLPYNRSRYQMVCEIDIASAYLILGENDRALDILENTGQMDTAYNFGRTLNLQFIFDRLRGNPRFDALLK